LSYSVVEESKDNCIISAPDQETVQEVKTSIKEEIPETQSTAVVCENEETSVFKVEFLETQSTELKYEHENKSNLKMECPETEFTEQKYEHEVTPNMKMECLETKWDHTDNINLLVSYVLMLLNH
jgi:hypothetical protein